MKSKILSFNSLLLLSLSVSNIYAGDLNFTVTLDEMVASQEISQEIMAKADVECSETEANNTESTENTETSKDNKCISAFNHTATNKTIINEVDIDDIKVRPEDFEQTGSIIIKNDSEEVISINHSSTGDQSPAINTSGSITINYE